MSASCSTSVIPLHTAAEGIMKLKLLKENIPSFKIVTFMGAEVFPQRPIAIKAVHNREDAIKGVQDQLNVRCAEQPVVGVNQFLERLQNGYLNFRAAFKVDKGVVKKR